MLNWKTLQRRRTLRRARLSDLEWRGMVAELPCLNGLSPGESRQLRDLTILFTAEKRFIAKQGLELDQRRRMLIAAQACLPVLQLGLDCYRDWTSVIVYPDRFVSSVERHDHYGIMHRQLQAVAGEAWQRGPLVLSWQDVLCHDREYNVVIHECAHKLDMLNGVANGFPPLHKEMESRWWTRVFSAAYADLCQRLELDNDNDNDAFDDYAAVSPGEFFAVSSELFFCSPHILRQRYPAVYRQLSQFYRQDPLRRGPGPGLLRSA